MPESGKEKVKRDNLTGRWQKGTVSPNPAGRPVKVDSLTGLLREFLGCAKPGQETHREVIIRAIVDLAEDGNVPAIKLIWDRCEGLLTQQIEQLSKVMVEYVDDWNDTEGVED